MKILIIPDKFKGTLSALEAAESIESGWLKGRPADTMDLMPMSDGGDGFGPVMSRLMQAATQITNTIDAAHRPCQVQWWWAQKTRIAIVESAQAIGLARLPTGKYHPFDLDTYGLGAVFTAAARHRPLRCLVAIGGSATNDGGFGVAKACGWQFKDKLNRSIEHWTELADLAHVHPPAHPLRIPRLTVAVDVNNPLLGIRGATRIYGPQKGLKPDDFPVAEASLKKLRQGLRNLFNADYSRQPGTGAAGGLGFGLRCFFKAELKPGFALFARHANLHESIQNYALVITGEGAIDASSTMGKGVGEIAKLCRRHSIPCLAFGGRVANLQAVHDSFTRTYALTPRFVSISEALQRPADHLSRLAEKAARNWHTC